MDLPIMQPHVVMSSRVLINMIFAAKAASAFPSLMNALCDATDLICTMLHSAGSLSCAQR